MTKQKLTKDEKRLMAIDEETEKQKKSVVDQLKKTPIVQFACERSGVGRSTYYKWRTTDRTFARAADKAKEAGCFLINDIAESRLIRMIQDDNLTANIFWLKHNNPKYATVNRVIHEYELVTDRPSTEEQSAFLEYLSRITAQKIIPKRTGAEIMKELEDEERVAELKAPYRKKMEEYMNDPENK